MKSKAKITKYMYRSENAPIHLMSVTEQNKNTKITKSVRSISSTLLKNVNTTRSSNGQAHVAALV